MISKMMNLRPIGFSNVIRLSPVRLFLRVSLCQKSDKTSTVPACLRGESEK